MRFYLFINFFVEKQLPGRTALERYVFTLKIFIRYMINSCSLDPVYTVPLQLLIFSRVCYESAFC